MKDPSKSGDCAYGCSKAPPWLNGPDCLSIEEKYKDPSIPAPSASLQPYLSKFSFVDGVPGGAFCIPAWYAFRYVRNSDGGYGPLSQWSGYDPTQPDTVPMAIFACAPNLPCMKPSPNSGPGSCSAIGVSTGQASSGFNKPTIALTAPIDFDIKNGNADGYTLNVHRQTGLKDGTKVTSFNPKSEGIIVGMFSVYPPTQSGRPTGPLGVYADFGDGLHPPNPNGGQSNCC